jgi:Sulfotransferase family
MSQKSPETADPARSAEPETATGTGPARAPGTPPTVIFIAGTGHSGSTLLERVLGEMPGFVNVGELIDLYRRKDAPHTERCGCGQLLAECPFWSKVREHMYGDEDWDIEQLASVGQLQRKVARQRHMPRLFAPALAGGEFRQELSQYGHSYDGLYRGIAAAAGARCVVDASKWPAQALALARSGADVRVIHLIRDSRGVAYSLSKKGVRRPQAVAGQNEEMWTQKTAACASGWVSRQLELELMHHWGVRSVRVRYEDLVSAPRRTVEALLTGLGVPYTDADLAHIGSNSVRLSASHGIAGNPGRFNDGEITLRADEAWREKMSPRDRRLVTAITLPLIVGYGWLPRRRPKP